MPPCRWLSSSRWPVALLLFASWRTAPISSFSTMPPRHRRARRGEAPLSLGPHSSPNSPAVTSAISPQRVPQALVEFYSNLDNMYNRSMSIKCPFIRRRIADVIDGAAMLLQFLIIRHKSLPGFFDLFWDGGDGVVSEPDGPQSDDARHHLKTAAVNNFMQTFSLPGCKPLGQHIKRHPDGTVHKTRHLPLEAIADKVYHDWTGGSSGADKGYYITGMLDSTIYRDDCLFIGPDPDMPVRGLRKYLSSVSRLFDQRQSFAQLLSITSSPGDGQKGQGTVKVHWKLGGVIMLPWHPEMEPWTGWTRYHLDEDGLIFLHEEGWDVSAWRAFICTLFPQARDWGIWEKIDL